MTTLESIKKNLSNADNKYVEGQSFCRKISLLQAFANVEAERLKFDLWGDYDLKAIGNNLDIIATDLFISIDQITQKYMDGEGEDIGALRVNLDLLETFVIKLFAISEILFSTENRNIPIKICGIGNRKELGGNK